MAQQLSPIHPGEILRVEFMEPLGITQYRLAKETAVPPRRINEIVHGKRAVSADTALRLARFFGTSEMFWLNLQARYDLDVQRQKVRSDLSHVRRFVAHPSRGVKSARALTAAGTRGAARSAFRRKAK